MPKCQSRNKSKYLNIHMMNGFLILTNTPLIQSPSINKILKGLRQRYCGGNVRLEEIYTNDEEDNKEG